MPGSIPSRSAIAQASAIAAIVAPAIRLLQSFAVCPAPGPPTSTGRPSERSSGSARSYTSGRPPTMIVSVADSAPRGPPLTGASSAASNSSARRRASAGGPVDMSMSRTPRGSSAATSSTASGEDSERIASSASSAASAAVAATAAPRAAARVGSRSHATTSWPAASRFLAIGRPIVPRPMKATLLTGRSGGCCELASELAEP